MTCGQHQRLNLGLFWGPSANSGDLSPGGLPGKESGSGLLLEEEEEEEEDY